MIYILYTVSENLLTFIFETRMHSSRMRTPPPGPGTPPGADPPGPGPPGAGTPPGPGTPREQTPLWTDRQLYKHNIRNFVADGNDKSS